MRRKSMVRATDTFFASEPPSFVASRTGVVAIAILTSPPL